MTSCASKGELWLGPQWFNTDLLIPRIKEERVVCVPEQCALGPKRAKCQPDQN
ncbi:hypothetical protein BDA96_01G108800 [Sorghum bicolor]|uniref:Uncharacterized protein n=1 Tax=Sorghum bicolor TaxID=4558 RepID=A0A921UX81_SORBI|nr:hypothetical protein BDA96_01G108800 [Sorghum bicolor]